MIRTIAAAAAVLSYAGAAQASFTMTYGDTFAAFGANMPYGSGNANANWAIARNGSIEIGLKAKERFVGELPENGAGVYTAQAGSPGSNSQGTWNIDWAFALPQAALPTNYDLKLFVDFDAGVGSTSFVVYDLDQTLANFFLNVNTGGDSQNPGFGFWGTGFPGGAIDTSGYIPYDPNALGEYEVKLVLSDLSGSVLAQSDIVVQVVPAPGAIALLGLGGLAAARRRRA